MNTLDPAPTRDAISETQSVSLRRTVVATVLEVLLLMGVFFIYAGDMTPMVNEAHYLVKAKNFWDPTWCQNDLFSASGKAHTTFYALFGWPTKFLSLATTTWIGRVVGWLMLAIGLQRLTTRLVKMPLACLGVAVVWIAGIEHGNLAGEWVVGGIEAKVPAYGCVLLAMAMMVDRRWNWVWPLLGVASAFHVLSGGWSVIAAMLAWFVTEWRGPHEDRQRLFGVPLFLGGAIALFGLVPALALTLGASSEDSAAAARIYTYFRIKHHLLPSDFIFEWYRRHGILIAMTFGAWFLLRLQVTEDRKRYSSIGWFCVGCVSFAIIGLLIGQLRFTWPDLTAKLLRYYWFRMSDAIVPLTLGLLVMRMVQCRKAGWFRAVQTIGLAVVCIATGLVAHSSLQKAQVGVPPSASNRLLGWRVNASKEEQLQTFADWKAVCAWARESTGPDEVFLTPRHQQSFKWYAHRAEVVNWKDVPQDAAALTLWQQRFDDVFPVAKGSRMIRVTIRHKTLRRYREDYGVRYLIVDRRVVGPSLPLVRVYPAGEERNDSYAVYELPNLVTADQ